MLRKILNFLRRLKFSTLRKLYKLVQVRVWRQALTHHGVAAAVEHIDVLTQLDNCKCVVDVGANRGQFALAVRGCLPEVLVYSFEPLVGPGEAFERVFSNDSKTNLFHVAIGPFTKVAPIHISARDDSSSLLPISPEQNRLFPHTYEISQEEIKVCKLVECLSANEIMDESLLKLDVQGFELQALIGSEELLPRFRWVYVECSFVELYIGQSIAHEVLFWLSERGFVQIGVYNLHYDNQGKAVQADFLFENRQND